MYRLKDSSVANAAASWAAPSLVAVYDLPNYFSKAYKPQQVKYFK
ncbi:hypothetical protein [Listeria grandensis]|nr:hypothetical protein [Listeria grandensis]